MKILLRHKMTSIIRENPTSGKVLGITATNEGRTVRIEAKKGVLIATGGHSSNVNFRRIFDPRRTEEYQVMDIQGQVIPGLYCAGESQGGFAQHGLGRALVFGRIAGRDAAVNGGQS